VEWLERLGRADVPHGTVASLEDLVGNLALTESGFFRRVEHPTEGPMITTDVTMRFSNAGFAAAPSALARRTYRGHSG
jgi:crotonobetainyl-CoA:carnitine CoA-transferase CaiB-like acyl-CoA transferase